MNKRNTYDDFGAEISQPLIIFFGYTKNKDSSFLV